MTVRLTIVLAFALLVGNLHCQASCAFASHDSDCPNHPQHQAPSLCSHDLIPADAVMDLAAAVPALPVPIPVEHHASSFERPLVAGHGPAPPVLRI